MLSNSHRDVDRLTREFLAEAEQVRRDAPRTDSVRESGIVHRCAADLESKPISWLWPGRIAHGKVSLIAGNPGLGKSQLSIALAATTTRGGNWPDGSPCRRGKIVILSAEDDPADTIRPRLEAAGADLQRVEIVEAVLDSPNSDGVAHQRSLNLQTDVERMGALLSEVGDVSLVVIDPITAYLGKTDSHKNAEVRSLFAPLGEIAAKHGAAIVAVTHLSKGGSTDPVLRVSGSLAFVAAVRSAWLVGKDPEDEGRRLFLPLKNNIGADDTGLAFRIEGVSIPSAAGPIETSRIVWQSGAVTTKASELMQSSDGDRGALDDAKDFLLDLLEEGPVSASKVRSEAKNAGISWATLKRSKAALGVESNKDGMGGAWAWSLQRGSTEPEGAQGKDVSPFGKSEPLPSDITVVL